MVKRMLWKDIRQTLSKSKGRVVSIVCLMALGLIRAGGTEGHRAGHAGDRRRLLRA